LHVPKLLCETDNILTFLKTNYIVSTWVIAFMLPPIPKHGKGQIDNNKK